MDAPIQTSKQPLRVDDAISYIYMDNNLFKAAEEGNKEELLKKYGGDLRFLVDRMLNTALHIYCRSGERERFSDDFMEELVTTSPSLLLQRNAKEEIPLHVAATNGNAEVIKFIIRHVKELERHEDPEKGTESEASSRRMMEMLRMKDEEENTPLHKAVESESTEVVQLLVKELDAKFSFSTNKRGETPLYLACKRGYHNLVEEILDICESMSMSMDYGHPDRTTALHAAVMSRDESTVRELIERKKDLIGEKDDKGRTPLHYAAHLGENWIVRMMLEKDASAAYISDTERGSTALHMAAWQGEFDLMVEIINYYPHCCKIVDKKGWNFLHFALVTISSYQELKRLLYGESEDNKFKDLPMAHYLHQKDNNGITPYHVFSLGPAYHRLVDDSDDKVSELFLDYDIFIMLYKERKQRKQQIWESLKEISNNVQVAGKHVHRSFFENLEEKEMEKEKAEAMKKQAEVKKKQDEAKAKLENVDKAREAHILVATLVATVTFAAAFTLPGGYNQEKGTAIMTHHSAFKAFIITDTLAFASSLLAIFLHFLLVHFRLDTTTNFQLDCIYIADGLTFFAMVAMVIAFSTGAYTVLQSSPGLSIAICSLALSIFFLGLLFVLFYFRDILFHK